MPGPGSKREAERFRRSSVEHLQMSSPMASKAILSSPTRAMFTARCTFSTSLAASATSALDTGTTVSNTRP